MSALLVQDSFFRSLFIQSLPTLSTQENVENFSGGMSSGVREGYNIGAWHNWHVLLKFLKYSIVVDRNIQFFHWRLGLFLWSSSSNCCEQSKVLSRGTHRQPGNCWTNMVDVAIILNYPSFLGRESEHGGAKCGWDPKTFGQDQGPSILGPYLYSYHSPFLSIRLIRQLRRFRIWNMKPVSSFGAYLLTAISNWTIYP